MSQAKAAVVSDFSELGTREPNPTQCQHTD